MGVAEDRKIVEAQERALVLERFDEQVAWELGSRIRVLAVERNLAVVTDVRRVGQPLFYMALAGTSPDNAQWVRRKVNVAERFHTSSYAIALRMTEKGRTLESAQGLPLVDFAAAGGSFPLVVAAAGFVGSATVSGLTGREDHELVVEALCGLLGKSYADLRLPAE